ncbi:MAG: putative metallopeptidase [Pedobacter sp.]|uniref:putative metallopeptidase n=1 Tax=Pedobacter sp. TaxID=1411316 RepID=UPI003564B8C9
MSKFTKADDEFQPVAKELFQKHTKDLGLAVDPSKIIFLRTDKKKKNAFAYCSLINEEYALLTDKKFFIVIVNKNYDKLETPEEKQYVVLHEMMHCYFDLDNDDEDKFAIRKHNIENFQELTKDPNWKLSLVK